MLAGQPPVRAPVQEPKQRFSQGRRVRQFYLPRSGLAEVEYVAPRKEVYMSSCNTGSDAKEWAYAGASDLFFAFAMGPTDDDLDCVRAVVLTASPDGTGGILFTVKEMDERERAAWKTAWMVLPPPTPSGIAVEPHNDSAMEKKNDALYRSKLAPSP